MNEFTPFGGYSGTMDPAKLRALMLQSKGLSLDSAPITPTPVQTVPIATTPPPVRMPSPEDVDAWRTGVDRDIKTGVTAPPAAVPAMPLATPRPPARFPTQDVPPIANVAAPTGPGGITLNSAPVAPGWAGTVGLPATPEEAKAFEKGGNYEKLMAGLDDVAKGLSPKPAADTGASTITPMSTQPNMPNQMAGELMAALLKSKQPRGLTLTGRQ